MASAFGPVNLLSSNGTYNSTEFPAGFAEMLDFFDFLQVCEKVFHYSLLAVGLPCNLVVALLIIVRRKLRRHAYQILIVAIATADCFVLIFVCFFDSLFFLNRWGGKSPLWLRFHCKYLRVFEFAATVASVWFVVLFSIERYYASVKPEAGRRLFSKARCVKYIGIVALASLILSLPHVLVNDFYPDRPQGYRCVIDQLWRKIVYVYQVVMVHAAPIIIIVGCNCSIVHQMYVAKRRHAERAHNSLVNKNVPKRAVHRATCFLIGLSVCYVILFTPKLIADLFHHCISDEFHEEYLADSKAYAIVTRFSECLYLLNSLVNFFVYTTLSPSFRRHLAKLFFIHLQAWRDSLESVQTGATTLDNGQSFESLHMGDSYLDVNGKISGNLKNRKYNRRFSNREAVSFAGIGADPDDPPKVAKSVENLQTTMAAIELEDRQRREGDNSVNDVTGRNRMHMTSSSSAVRIMDVVTIMDDKDNNEGYV